MVCLIHFGRNFISDDASVNPVWRVAALGLKHANISFGAKLRKIA